MSTTVRPHLDETIARAAVSWSLDPVAGADETADHLLALAGGNRTAVERALGRLRKHDAPSSTPSRRAMHVLQLTLARGRWDW